MKFNLFLFIYLFIYCFVVQSQNKSSSNIVLGISENVRLNYYQYIPKLTIKGLMSSISEANNNYPEELMMSILSAQTQEWVDYNSFPNESDKKSSSHFKYIKNMNKEKNFFVLHHKLYLKLGDVDVALIKFFFHKENQKPISGCYVMKKVNDKWKRTSDPSLSLLSLIVMRLKSKVLQGIILGNSKDIRVENFRRKVFKNRNLDVSALHREFLNLYENKNSSLIDLFIDKKTW